MRSLKVGSVTNSLSGALRGREKEEVKTTHPWVRLAAILSFPLSRLSIRQVSTPPPLQCHGGLVKIFEKTIVLYYSSIWRLSNKCKKISVIPDRVNKWSINVSYGKKLRLKSLLTKKIIYKYIMEIQHVNEIFLAFRLI